MHDVIVISSDSSASESEYFMDCEVSRDHRREFKRDDRKTYGDRDRERYRDCRECSPPLLRVWQKRKPRDPNKLSLTGMSLVLLF